jgi:hypothetical protein
MGRNSLRTVRYFYSNFAWQDLWLHSRVPRWISYGRAPYGSTEIGKTTGGNVEKKLPNCSLSVCATYLTHT